MKLTYKPKNKRPISDWLEAQGRFRHMAKDAEKVEELQQEVDRRWDLLLAMCGEK